MQKTQELLYTSQSGGSLSKNRYFEREENFPKVFLIKKLSPLGGEHLLA